MQNDVKVIKRNGQEVPFDKQKIINAILSANKDVSAEDRISEEVAKKIGSRIEEKCSYRNSDTSVEEIQDMVENMLMEKDYYNLAKAYIKYRYLQAMARDRYSELMNTVEEKLTASNVQNQNANVDERSFGGRIGEMSGAVMKKIALETMNETSRNNHLNNEVYIHDLDSWYIADHNCLSIPFDRLLAKGFNTRQTDVRPASSINTAMQLVAVIFQLQSLMQFGGVAATHIDWTLVPYVQKSFYKHFVDGLEFCEDVDPNSTIIITKYGIKKQLPLDSEDCQVFPKAYKYAMRQTKKELDQAVEGMYHNLNTLQSRSGNQLPFSSLNYGTCTSTEGRMVIRALLDGSIKGVGKNHKTPIFPCGIFQLKTGINRKPGDPNYDLFKLAIKSTSQRLYPNYANCDWSNQLNWEKADMNGRQKVIDELSSEKYELLKIKLQENESEQDFFGLSIKDGKIIAEIIQKPETLFSTMGCRTVNGLNVRFFDFYKKNIEAFIEDKPINREFISGVQKDGRGNISPVTIILPTIAMEAGCDVEKFMELLSKKIDEAKDTLLERYELICSQPPEAAKFMYENHTMGGYIPEEGIRSAIQNGTNVIGQLGDAEALQLLVGCNQTKPEGMELLKRIEQLYNDKCNKFKNEWHYKEVKESDIKNKMIQKLEKILNRKLSEEEKEEVINYNK